MKQVNSRECAADICPFIFPPCVVQCNPHTHTHHAPDCQMHANVNYITPALREAGPGGGERGRCPTSPRLPPSLTRHCQESEWEGRGRRVRACERVCLCARRCVSKGRGGLGCVHVVVVGGS